MALKRFSMVPVDSSAARMPLPGATSARAVSLSVWRFMGRRPCRVRDARAAASVALAGRHPKTAGAGRRILPESAGPGQPASEAPAHAQHEAVVGLVLVAVHVLEHGQGVGEVP